VMLFDVNGIEVQWDRGHVAVYPGVDWMRDVGAQAARRREAVLARVDRGDQELPPSPGLRRRRSDPPRRLDPPRSGCAAEPAWRGPDDGRRSARRGSRCGRSRTDRRTRNVRARFDRLGP
jgi:hypothetical protein